LFVLFVVFLLEDLELGGNAEYVVWWSNRGPVFNDNRAIRVLLLTNMKGRIGCAVWEIKKSKNKRRVRVRRCLCCKIWKKKEREREKRSWAVFLHVERGKRDMHNLFFSWLSIFHTHTHSRSLSLLFSFGWWVRR
jgi:hypothetical protein